jgi:hypothetical protein
MWDSGAKATPENVTDSMEKVRHIGNQRAGKILNQLESDGFEVVRAED